MPLIVGYSKKAIQENIRRLIVDEGKSRKQAAAIAYNIARETALNKGNLSRFFELGGILS